MGRGTLAGLLGACAFGVPGAVELTRETWGGAVANKRVLVKFVAPWCSHCKQMKPDWDRLMKELAGSSSLLVAEVDCGGAGKALCQANKIESLPTIKWGEPDNMTRYEGDRDFAALSAFVVEQGLACAPDRVELCDHGTRAAYEWLINMSDADLSRNIDLAREQVSDAQRKLGLMSAVRAARERGTSALERENPRVGTPSRPPKGTKQYDDSSNPILYIRHFTVYVVAPGLLMVVLSVFAVPFASGRAAPQKQD